MGSFVKGNVFPYLRRPERSHDPVGREADLAAALAAEHLQKGLRKEIREIDLTVFLLFNFVSFPSTWMTSLLASSHFCLISSFLVPTNSFISSTLPWSLKNK